MVRKKNRYRAVFFVAGLVALCIMVWNIRPDVIIRNIRETGWWFAAIIGIWAVVYFIVLALGLDLTFPDSVIIIAMTSLISNILFFAPLQLGTREGGFLLAFQGIAMSSGLGVYVSLITRIRETFWIMTGLLLMHGRRKKQQV